MELPEESYELYYQFAKGKISRDRFVKRLGVLGCSALTINAFLKAYQPGIVEAAEKSLAERAASANDSMTVTVYDWILTLNPVLYTVVKAYNAKFKDRLPVKLDIASSANFSINQFLLEARHKKSTWDVYFGTTPFVEMTQLLATGATEPWDPYVTTSFIGDLIPAVRKESTVNGKLIDLPMMLDVIGMGYRKDYFQAAGITSVPTTWEAYISTAQTISSKLANHKPHRVYGATYDLRPWRSFIPIAHSIDTNIYSSTGYLDWSKIGVFKQALTYMKEIIQYAPPDVFNPGLAEAASYDEFEFKSGTAAMLEKYYNAPVRCAKVFGAAKLGLSRLPKPASGGAGGTVFWNTGAALLKYGQHKQEAGLFFEWLSSNSDWWHSSVSNAQLPCITSAYNTVLKPWAPGYVSGVLGQLAFSKAIPNDLYNLAQFTALSDAYTPFLKGTTSMDDALSTAQSKIKKAIATGAA
jgi:ABC-type glycerol-3-phosphate transport system substrate-binding protein